MKRIKKNDLVVVISGKDKGKQGKVLALNLSEGWVKISGVALVKRHTKPSQKNPAGGLVTKEAKINSSKVLVVDPSTGKGARSGVTIDKNGAKVRTFKKSPSKKSK